MKITPNDNNTYYHNTYDNSVTINLMINKTITCIVSMVFFTTTAHSAIEFTDMSNQHIRLNTVPERVVVIPIPAASMLVGLDESSEKLVGMHPFAGVAAREGMLSNMFPAVLNVRSDMVGNNFTPNIEALLSVKPDLVWQWGHRGDDIISPMRNVGLRVATLNYGKERDTQRWITLMGTTLGKTEKAEGMLRWRREVIHLLGRKTATIPEKEQPQVLYLSHFNQRIQTFGSTSHNNADFALAGGVSLNRNLTGSRTLNIEQIITWDPDVILLGNFEQGLKPDDVYQNLMLSEVKAVRERRVYKLPVGGFVWDAPNQETPLYWQWLSMLFHPRAVHWPLREEIQRRYQQIYGYNVTQAQIDKILQTELNRGSRDYLKLFGMPDE